MGDIKYNYSIRHKQASLGGDHPVFERSSSPRITNSTCWPCTLVVLWVVPCRFALVRRAIVPTSNVQRDIVLPTRLHLHIHSVTHTEHRDCCWTVAYSGSARKSRHLLGCVARRRGPWRGRPRALPLWRWALRLLAPASSQRSVHCGPVPGGWSR